MPEGIRSNAGRRTASLRQLKLLVLVLIVSNIAVGALGFYSLRETDRKYSRLVDQTVSALGELERLTKLSVEVMRGTNPLWYDQSPENRAQMLSKARDNLARDRELSERLVEHDSLSDRAGRESLRGAAESFHKQAGAVIDLIAAGNMAEANRERDQLLRPAFERYLEAVQKSADLLERQSLRTSDDLTARTGGISNIILGIAGWPLFLLAAILIASVIMILLMRIFLFNDHEGAT